MTLLRSILLLAFLVSWKVTALEETSCPGLQSVEVTDPYTGKTDLSNVSCAAIHYREVSYPMSREFKTKREARKFVDDAKSKDSVLSDFKIQEIK